MCCSINVTARELFLIRRIIILSCQRIECKAHDVIKYFPTKMSHCIFEIIIQNILFQTVLLKGIPIEVFPMER